MSLRLNDTEQERLESLHSLQLLDTPPSAMFDRITKLASILFASEISVISLVDQDRQWFLSRLGLDVQETPRDQAFCAVTIEGQCILDVPDAAMDPRFANNPLVLSGPRIRSYIGHPVHCPSGYVIGTLAVIDPRPHKFGGLRREKLGFLAGVVEDLLRKHQQTIEMTELAEQARDKRDALEKANRIFVTAEKAARIGSWEIDLTTMDLTWSQGVYEMHGIPYGQPIQLDHAINAYAGKDRERVSGLIDVAVAEGKSFQFEADIEDTDGNILRVQARGEAIEGDTKNPDRLVGVIHDITESHHTKLALQRAADYDSLTDLLNRNAFDRILGEKIKQQGVTGQTVAVMLLDLDGFKAINDTFGHLVGDMVLQQMSERLRESVPEDVVIARWGGDEFVFIPPLGSTPRDIEALWDMMSKVVYKPFHISGHKLVVHGTVGVGICDEEVAGREIVRRADIAMYTGKKRASGTLSFYNAAHAAKHTEKLHAVTQVREAIQDNRLFAAYQPIVDLLTDEVVGMEALMRVRSPDGSLLSAGNLMPAIGDPHVSREIGDIMVSKICAEHSEILRKIDSIRSISFNASEADLLSQNYASKLLSRLDKAGLDPASLTLEVTETMLMVNDNEAARKVLVDLKTAGMQIALDDFGTGFSSLTHLRDFPIDIVKIDRSFVKIISSDHQSRLIVQAIIAMAQSLEIEVIAEGIETKVQRDLLAFMGCRYGQGFLLGHPLSHSQIERAQEGQIKPRLPGTEPAQDRQQSAS